MSLNPDYPYIRVILFKAQLKIFLEVITHEWHNTLPQNR